MSINSDNNYKLEKSQNKRMRAEQGSYIIVSQTSDFLMSSKEIPPELIYEDRKFRSNKFLRMAKKEYHYKTDFSHFYIEMIENYYARIAGLAMHYKSPFLEDLSKNGLINPQYENGFLVSLFGNYTVELGDPVVNDQYDVMGYTIADLMYTFRVPINKVVFLNDIFDHKKNKSLKDPFGVDNTKIEKDRLKLFINKFYV